MTLVWLLLLLIPLPCCASGLDYWGYTLKAFGSLLLVLGLIVFFFFIFKKINAMGKYSNARIKLKGKLYLDNKHYIAMIEVDGKEMLVGVGEDVSLLKEYEDERG